MKINDHEELHQLAVHLGLNIHQYAVMILIAFLNLFIIFSLLYRYFEFCHYQFAFASHGNTMTEVEISVQYRKQRK